jgi:hypothetical protein
MTNASAEPQEARDSPQPEQPSNVAFTVTLKPADAAPAETAPKPGQVPTVLPETLATIAPPAAANPAPPAETNSRAAATPGGNQPSPDPESFRKPADSSVSTDPLAAITHIPASPLTAPESQPPAAKMTEPAATAEAPAPTASTPTDPAPPVQTRAAHDIKFQVAGEGEQRVEVRVTERGGDVFVAVRTPDSRLAGDLRQDLPALAGRLEQSGFHATTWQPPATGERERLADPQAAASGQDAQGQSRQNGREPQRDPEQQKQEGPENPASPAQQNEKGKDFEWLLSSIR